METAVFKYRLYVCRSQRLPGGRQQICDSPLLRKKHSEYTHSTSLFSLLSVRLREGYTIKEVTLLKSDTQIEVKMVLPWSHDVWIEYVTTAAWPFTTNKYVCRITVWRCTPQVRSGQVGGYTPEQRVAASTLRRYSFGLRLAIAQTDTRPISFS